MTRRILFVAALPIVGVLLLALWPMICPQPPCPVDVGPASFDKLQIGMNESEVEAILGGPAGDYRTRPGVWYVFAGSWSGSIDDPVPTFKEWETDHFAILVSFGPDGRAVGIEGAGAIKDSPFDRHPLLQMLRRLVPVP
jgi:hypothetical protein